MIYLNMLVFLEFTIDFDESLNVQSHEDHPAERSVKLGLIKNRKKQAADCLVFPK